MNKRSFNVQTISSALAATGLTLSSLVNPVAAQAAKEVTLGQTSSCVQVQRNWMGNSSAHSIAISRKFWSATSSEVVIVESTDSFAIAVAGPLARSKNVPLLLIDGSAPSPVKDELRRLGTSTVSLVGPGFNPKTLLRQEINSVVASQTWVTGAGPQEHDSVVASMFPGAIEEVFLTDAVETVDLVTASAASAFQRSPVFTVGTSLSLGDKGELQRLKPKRAFYIGSSTPVSQTVAHIEALGIPVLPIEGGTAIARNETVVRALQAKNFDGRTLTVASQTAPNAALAASFGASMESNIPQFPASQTTLSGPIREQAVSWGPELKSATIIGPATGVTDTYKNQLQTAVATPRAVAPSFHVLGTGTNADGSGWIDLSAQPGAARYTLTDLAGTQVYNGASPRLPIPSDGTTFKAVAFNSTGGKLSERDVRVAINPGEAGNKTKVAATSDATTTHLNWSEGATTLRSRQITRHEMVRNAQGQLTVTGSVRLGTTCGSSFTDAARPATKEIIYEVSQHGTNATNICSATTPQTKVREPKVDLTALRVPAAPAAASTFRLESTSASEAPTPTTTELSLMQHQAKATEQTFGTQSSTSRPWTFRYQTFIPEPLIRPLPWDNQVFDGNNRSFGAWKEPFKTRADVTFYFDERRQISTMYFGKATGVTTEYSCPGGTFNNCSTVRQAQAGTEGIKWFDKRYPGTARVARVEHDVAIPIQPHGVLWGLVPVPGISYTMDILYWPNGFSVTGVHDGAPAHEIWGGWVPGEYIPIMTHDRGCDFGVGLAGFCSVGFNIKV